MFLVRRPNDDQVREFLATQRDQPFTYPTAGIDAHPASRGYTVDHNRIRLGSGPATYQKAVEAIKKWEMFNIGWLQLCWPDAPIEASSDVAVLAHHFGFWSLHACRIVSVIDQDAEHRRFGFIYGTLPDHAERGQEQFTVEWHHGDDSVSYDILAYSKPHALLARLGFPITRSLQKRFARDSMKAMVRAAL